MGKLNTVQNGKGSKPRTTNREVYRNNYDLITWSKPKDKYNESTTTSTEPRGTKR